MSTDKKGRAFDPVAKKKAKQAEEDAIAAGRKLKDEARRTRDSEFEHRCCLYQDSLTQRDGQVRKDIIEGVANTIRLTNPKGVRGCKQSLLICLSHFHTDCL